MRRSIAASVVLAAAAGLAVATAPPAAATDTKVALALTSVRDVVVDDVHDKVFLSGGSSSVAVYTAEGAFATTIANQPNAMDMDLSPDSSKLYVALHGGDAISVISTTTLAETSRIALAAQSCVASVVAVTGGLWFGYGCSGGHIGYVDLTGEAPAITYAKEQAGANFFYSPPHLELAPGTTPYLVAAYYGSSPSSIHSMPITGTTLGTITSRQVGSNLQDFAVSPDGTQVTTASGSPYNHPRYRVSDLASDGVFGESEAYPNAVAVSTGHVVTGTMASYDHDVRVYRTDGTLVREYELGGTSSVTMAPGALAVNADTSRVFAVMRDWDGHYWLHVLRDATKTPTTITLTKPSTAKINTSYTLTGTLSAGSGKVVHVKRSSAYGTVTLANRTTGSGGSFAITDTVSKRGVYTYTATFDGDATYAGTVKALGVKVLGLTPSLTIATNASTYRYGATAYVTAHLGSTQSRTVNITAKPYGSSTTTLRTGTVNSSGNLTTSRVVSRRTTFYAVFAGDAVYEPRTVYRTVTVGAKLSQALAGYYSTSGSYRLFRRTTDPQLGVTVSPNNAGTCMSFTAQAYTSGAWRTFATQACIALDYNSRAVAVLVGDHPAGVNMRIRSTFNGSTLNARTTGGWLYLRFT